MNNKLGEYIELVWCFVLKDESAVELKRKFFKFILCKCGTVWEENPLDDVIRFCKQALLHLNSVEIFGLGGKRSSWIARSSYQHRTVNKKSISLKHKTFKLISNDFF